MSYLQNEFRQTGSFLIPLRLFVGVYFIVASVSKFFDSQWHTGVTLANILQQQLQTNEIVFPFYESFVSNMLLPNVEIAAGIILFLELYSGLAIFFGIFTNLALISGIVLYVNLLFFGKLHLSILLIVTQAVLLGMNSGAILGFDKVLSRRIHSEVLVAQREQSLYKPKSSRFVFVTIAVWFLLFALLSISYSSGLTTKPLEDATLSIAILSAMASMIFLILAIQVKIQDTQKQTLLIPGPVANPYYGQLGSEGATMNTMVQPVAFQPAFQPGAHQPAAHQPTAAQPTAPQPTAAQPRMDSLPLQGHHEHSPQRGDTPVHQQQQAGQQQAGQQPVTDNRALVNEYSKLIVPHHVGEPRAPKAPTPTDEDPPDDNDSPALRKLYLE